MLAAYQLAINRISWLSKSSLDLIFDVKAIPGAASRPLFLMMLVGAAAFIARLVHRRVILGSVRRVDYDLRKHFLGHLHVLGSSFYRRTPPGEIISRVLSDLAQLRTLFGEWTLTVLSLVFGAVASLQVMLHISSWLTLASFATFPLQVLAVRLSSRPMLKRSHERQELLERLYALALRYFSGIRLVRSLAMEQLSEQTFVDATDKCRVTSDQAAYVRATMGFVLGGIDALSMLAIFWYGSYLLSRGQAAGGISVGGLFAFFLAWRRLSGDLAATSQLVEQWQRSRISFRRLRRFFDTEPEIELRAAVATPASTVALKVTDLSYEVDGRAILQDVSFELPAGGSLAIVGRTGSGKSALAGLLARLSPTPVGSVFLNGRDLCELDHETLRTWVTYAQQEPFLFSTDIADNVALGMRLAPGGTPSPELLASALADAQISAEVARLPQGAATLVGERGAQLSGGQRQRIALARALVSNAPLSVLDDPLSAVDAATETAILDTLLRRTRGRSLVLITNRVAAASRCDRVLVLDGGRVVQLGVPADLLAEPGAYRQLAEEQRLAGPAAAAQVREEVATDVRSEARAAVAADAAPSAVASRRGLSHVWPFIAKERRAIVFALLLLLVGAVLSALGPAVIGSLSEAALHGRSLLRPGLYLLAMFVVGNISLSAQLVIVQTASARAMAALRVHLFQHASRLSLRVFDRMPAGQLVTHVVSDVDAVQGLFNPEMFNATFSVVALVLSIVVMLLLDVHLAMIALSVLPCVATVVFVVVRRSRNAHRVIRTAIAELTSMLNEQIMGISVIRALGGEATMAARYETINARVWRASIRVLDSDSFLYASVDLIRTVALAVMLLWAAHLQGTSAALAFGTVLAFSQYLAQFFAPILAIGSNASAVQGALASVDRFAGLLENDEVEAADAPVAAVEAAATAGPVFGFDSVSFAYSDGRPALDGVSFAANRGDRIAVVGATGAGKSTLSHLLLRLYDVNDGAIRVLGRDVRSWSRESLRRSIAVVPQEVTLLPGTLLENIALGDPAPDRQRAQVALDRCGLDASFIARVGGLDARIDEGGQNFSAGERQLITIARAIYKDAPILILDEATASVDSRTEALAQRALAELLAGRTTLVIAHRLSTIESADRILVFDRGRLVEEGDHTELIHKHGVYSRLHALQRT